MKTKSIVAVSAVLLAVMFGVLCASATAATSYPFRVRGGKLQISFEQTKTPSQVKLIVVCSPANRAGSAGLSPGQGSWMDRGMRPGEPNRLEYYILDTEAKTIFDYLRSPANYYVFECFNTGKGYLQVTKAYTKSVRID